MKPLLLMASALGLAVLTAAPLAVARPTSQEDVLSPREFINSWLVLGTFDNKHDSGFNKELIAEKSVLPKPGKGDGGKVWRYFDDRLFNRNYDDYQDLYSYFSIKLKGSSDGKVAYAHTYVFSETDQVVKLKVGADTACRAWLNGEMVMDASKVSWHKDAVEASASLKAGWNSLLLKIANVEDGRFGFYARLTLDNGENVPGLTYSVSGPGDDLAVATGAMGELSGRTMPLGWREWPYVGAQPDTRKIDSGDDDGSLLRRFVTNRNLLMEATDFVMQATGGSPPYKWTIVDGALPAGVNLDSDGRLTGTIQPYAELQSYPFKVKVTDSKGVSATEKLTIEVRERPNKWYEEARLVALSHRPENIPKDGYDSFAKLIKERGYQVVMPVSYNNGDYFFRYPSKFAPAGTEDIIGDFKAALDQEGVRMGMYFGSLNVGTDLFTPHQQGLVVEDAILKYKPVAIWLDLTLLDSEAPDALYSMVRTLDENLVIVVNGNLGTHGDWDEICFEGWTAWGDQMWEIWPIEVPWPKKHAPESWRWVTAPDSDDAPRAIAADWQEYLRVQLSLIGEGYVADIDISYRDGRPEPHVPYGGYFVDIHGKMAAWSNPAGLPTMNTSFTQVNPGPLEHADWGYNMINVPRNTIYLHMMKNSRGKTGVPTEPTLRVGPLSQKVKSITWMNTNKPVNFTQPNTSTDQGIIIDLTGITADPVDTILKIELAEPLPGPQPPTGIPHGNLATFKPARLLSLDGTQVLGPSSMHVPGGAKRGVDGDPLTAAVAGGSYAWTYEVDLERIYPVDRIVVNQRKDRQATEFEVVVSPDGETWKTVAHKTDSVAGADEFTFSSQPTRFVRVRSLKPDGEGQPGGQGAIAELEVYQSR